MKAIFETGPLAGLLFEVPDVPPKGLDVEHGGMVLRYGYLRIDGEAVLYDFCERRWRSTRRAHPIWLGGGLNGAALPFYPAKPENYLPPQGDFFRPGRIEPVILPTCVSRPRSSLSTVVSLGIDTGKKVSGEGF